jgi:putative FmdB family regulatory protein
MPLYEYECTSCGKIFTAALSLREHEQKNATCPGCGSKKVLFNKMEEVKVLVRVNSRL